MKYKIFFAFTCILCLFSCKSSYTKIGDENANYIPYYLKMYEADSLFLVENYQRSYEILDSLFKKYEPINSENEYFTYVASKIMLDKKPKEIKKDFIYLLENFGNQTVNIVFSPEKVKTFLTETDTLGIDTRKALEKYAKSIDIPLRNLVLSMTKKDISARKPNPDFEKIEIVNAENTRLLDSLFKINKFPSLKLVGKATKEGEDSEVGAIMIHTNQEYKEQFLMEKSYDLLKKGEITPNAYSTIYNRYYLIKNETLYYSVDIGKKPDIKEKQLINM